MKLLAACSLGGTGHLHPLLAFLAAAERRGDEVLVTGPPSIGEAVDTAGYRFRSGSDPSQAEVASIRERLPVAPPDEAARLANRVLFGELATAAMLPVMDRVLSQFKPDLVLRDPCEYASAVSAHRTGVPTAQVGIGMAEVEWASVDVATPVLEHHRPGLVEEIRSSPYLTAFPLSLDPSPFADTRRFAEPIRPPGASLPHWWGDSQAPLVYVTFGTVLGHMALATEAYQAALAAVASMDARVLLTVGRHYNFAQLGGLPANVHVENWVDQDEVLAEAEVVVCHGGSGTTFGSLAAGVPVVVVPLFADQFANGARVTESGAGIVLDRESSGRRRPLSRVDAPSLTEAIETVRHDLAYRMGAERIAVEMAAAPPPGVILDGLLAAL